MASNPIWLDAFDEKGKLWPVELTYDLPGELEEAGLALEVSDPALAKRLFGLAYRLRHARGARLLATDATGRLLPRRRSVVA